MNPYDSYHETQVRKVIFANDLHFVLLNQSYVASSLVRQHYAPSDLAWQSLHDKLDEYRDLLRKAQALLERVETSLEKKILDNKLEAETPF